MTDKTTYALLIYRTDEGDLDTAGTEGVLTGHRTLQSETARRRELHAVARLSGPETAKTVRLQKDAHDVTDGPYAEAKEWLVGFYLLDCANEDEAIERAKILVPHPGHAIEVRPVNWRWRR